MLFLCYFWLMKGSSIYVEECVTGKLQIKLRSFYRMPYESANNSLRIKATR